MSDGLTLVDRRSLPSPVRAATTQRQAHGVVHLEAFTKQGAASPLPTLVLSLPDQIVRTANTAAAELLGLGSDLVVGRRAADLMVIEQSRVTEQALAALADGALESYLAQRTFVSATGSVEGWIWVRSIPRTSGCMALLQILPTSQAGSFDPAPRSTPRPPAIDLASGTIDRSGRVVTITRGDPDVLHVRHEGALGSWHLASEVHADDQLSLFAALRDARADDDGVIVGLRVRHGSRGWIASDCHVFSTGDGDLGHPVGFVLTEATPRSPASGRVAELERRLDRIASEVRAAGLGRSAAGSTGREAETDLGTLTPRQRDIVQRLLAGSRVPSIAAALYVSRSTVRNHLAGVYRVFGVHSQAELIEVLQPCARQPAS